jgi:hypothetical protein
MIWQSDGGRERKALMDIPLAEDQVQKRWWWALRRAYRIPDIVQTENAWVHLGHLIIGDEDTRFLGEDERVNAGLLVAAVVLDLGERGELDATLLTPAFDVHKLCEEESLKWSATSGFRRVIVERAAMAIDEITHFIQHNPGATEELRTNYSSI